MKRRAARSPSTDDLDDLEDGDPDLPSFESFGSVSDQIRGAVGAPADVNDFSVSVLMMIGVDSRLGDSGYRNGPDCRPTMTALIDDWRGTGRSSCGPWANRHLAAYEHWPVVSQDRHILVLYRFGFAGGAVRDVGDVKPDDDLDDGEERALRLGKRDLASSMDVLLRIGAGMVVKRCCWQQYKPVRATLDWSLANGNDSRTSPSLENPCMTARGWHTPALARASMNVFMSHRHRTSCRDLLSNASMTTQGSRQRH